MQIHISADTLGMSPHQAMSIATNICRRAKMIVQKNQVIWRRQVTYINGVHCPAAFVLQQHPSVINKQQLNDPRTAILRVCHRVHEHRYVRMFVRLAFNILDPIGSTMIPRW